MAVPSRKVDLRKKQNVKDLMKAGRGFLTDLSGNKQIEIDWHLNEQADKDKIFKISINGEVAYIDLEELIFYTRIMF